MEIKIKSAVDLIRLSPHDLEQQANILLYGHPLVLEEACEREVIQRLYIPRNLNKPLIYSEPKIPKSMNRNSPILQMYKCIECGRPRHYSAAQRCRFCYTLHVRLKFYEKRDGHDWLERQAKGIVMPETEWWDDSDIPTLPKRIGPIGWNIDRLDWMRA